MLHSILFAPFSDAAAEAHAEALQATLAGAATEGVLLVNLSLPEAAPILALVQPGGVTVMQLLATGGTLSTPALTAAPWQLDGQALAGFESSISPWQQFQQQRAALAEWLSQQPEFPAVASSDVAGLVVCLQPVHFAGDVEAGLQQLPATEQFQLVPALGQLPRRLQQLEPQVLLPPTFLHQWAELLRQRGYQPTTPEEVPEEAYETQPGGFVAGKLRQLWGWLGAEDVPADPPYGGLLASGISAANEQEKQRLEQLRQQVTQELQQQRQAMEAREAQQAASIAQLRQQLTQAPSSTAEVADLQARLNTEMQEKQQLQQAIQASRTEAEARNQALDARIQQLGNQLEQLQRQPAAATPTPATVPVSAPPAARSRATAAAPGPTWRLQWARAALVVLSIGALGAGLWGVTKLPTLLRPVLPAATRATQASDDTFDDNAEAAAPTLFDIQPDTVAVDSADTSAEEDEENIVPADSLETPARAGELLDSVAADEPSGDI
ncbi:hypothetical protein [Hymenobacter sp. UYP22]|uniref:hypothetical protein n=1 Tax=Hymenobacter sp. UYP22 TaxID=3156348 RepID=UPI003395D7AE